MDLIDRCGCNVDCGLISEGKVCSPDIIVDGLRKMDYVEAFFTKEVRCLLCSVSAEDNNTIEALLCQDRSHPEHASA